jgi:hypothetical protein
MLLTRKRSGNWIKHHQVRRFGAQAGSAQKQPLIGGGTFGGIGLARSHELLKVAAFLLRFRIRPGEPHNQQVTLVF